MVHREVVVFVSIVLLIIAVLSAIFFFHLSPFWIIALTLFVLAASFLSPRLIEFKEFERGVIFRFGKFRKVGGPGWVWTWPAFENSIVTDMRVSTIDLPAQDVITRDDVEIKVDAIIYAKIVDPKKAVVEVKDFKAAMRELLKSQIRNTISKMELEEVLEKTDEIKNDLELTLKTIAQEWGISVVKVEVQAINLPPSLIQAMHRRREAGEHKLKLEIEAQAKQLSLEILNKATSTLDPKTMSFLYIDALKSVANGRATKIILPLELANMARAMSDKLSVSDASIENVLSKALKTLSAPDKK